MMNLGILPANKTKVIFVERKKIENVAMIRLKTAL